MLDAVELFTYLCEHGWVEPDWVVDGDLSIRSLASRNRNLGVEGPGGIGYVIKQPEDQGSGSRRTLANEASFYKFCHKESAVEELSRFLPKLVYHDLDCSLLIMEFIPRATSPGTSETEPFSAEGSQLLGRALGVLHRLFRNPSLVDDSRLGWVGNPLPLAFSMHRPWPSLLASLSPAEVRVHQIIQEQDGLDLILQQCRNRWCPETLIHGDVKSSNILIRSDQELVEGSAQPIELWLIDWEFVQFGDPAWDLAGAFQDFIFQWVWSMPSEPDLPVEERTARARYPLDAIRPSIRALWHGYRESATLEPMVANELIARAVSFSAIRLIQTALAISAEQEQLTSRAVLLLQISVNLLANPLFGQTHLYGITSDLVTS